MKGREEEEDGYAYQFRAIASQTVEYANEDWTRKRLVYVTIGPRQEGSEEMRICQSGCIIRHGDALGVALAASCLN